MKPTILISIPLVWGVRNILGFGLYDRLSERYRVVLAIPHPGVQSLIDEGISSEDLMVLPAVEKLMMGFYPIQKINWTFAFFI